MERDGANDDVCTAVESRTLTTERTKPTKNLFKMHLRRLVFVCFVSSVVPYVAGCAPKPSQPQPIVAVTRTVGSWQGRGTRTVGDVPSETGRFRILWETTNESAPGAATFKLTLRSAISGRTIGIVADYKGTGAGTAEYDEGPRTYDFLVESANVDWAFRVEETSGEFANSSPATVPAKR